MGKLNDIIFKQSITKEFEVLGKKVILRTLTTKDNLDMDYTSFQTSEELNIKDILKTGLDILSRSLVSIDGVVPESAQETKDFLLNQDQSVIIDLLSKYQTMVSEEKTEIKK